MNFLKRTFSIFFVALRRLFAQRGLAVATAIGLIVSIAIVMSIPLYTDAVYYQILQDELSQADEESTLQRPPFAFMFRYIGSLYGLKEWEDVEQVDTYLTERGPELLGLPHKQTVRYTRTDNFRLFPADQASYADVRDPLEWISFAFATDFEEHITLVEGAFPAPAEPGTESTVEILVTEAMADELGIQVGESYTAFRNVETDQGGNSRVQVPVRVAGVWRAIDPDEEYWFYRQSVFDTQFFISEPSFLGRIAPVLNDEVAQILWYLIMDGSAVNSDDVGWLLNGIAEVQQQAATLLANTRLEVSPQEALWRYRSSSQLLNVLLYAFSIPIIGLLLAFIGLVVGLAVNRQRNEIAVLRSRGATTMQILGIALLEALILGVIALGIGIFASQWVAGIIGATRSFLNFTVDSDLRIAISNGALRFGVGAVIIAILAQVIPSIGASRHTIVTFKQEQARTLRPPWWQRAWLDVLLLLPVLYGTYLLDQEGAITSADAETGFANGPFDNPLLFLIPALGALALTLLVLRILPLMMKAIAWIAAQTDSVGFLLATRYLSRDPGFYSAPLVLLVLTLSLSTYTASLAQTLDNHLFDRTYYQTGADTWLVELGTVEEATPPPPGSEAAAADTAGDGGGGGAPGAASIDVARWVFVPISEHTKVDGIQEATRLGDFEARIQAQGSWVDATFVGVDRVDFPKVAYWRRDFAPASLGALMNALAISPDGVLLPSKFMRENTIREGDSIVIRVSSYGQRAEMSVKVVGRINYFPTWYPEEEGPLIVGNLDYLFEQLGGTYPYDVLISNDAGMDYEVMTTDLRKLDLAVLNLRSSLQSIAEEQQLPQRQGMFGVLSVGFLAAALLTVLGFLLYALFSFRRRFIELGTLRAIGLSPFQMTTFLAWELIFLILLGLGAGTLLGTVMSEVYIPYLQVGAEETATTPPFVVEIAWPAIMRIYGLFGILFVVALTVLAVLLMRMKIFQAIKLGETV